MFGLRIMCMWGVGRGWASVLGYARKRFGFAGLGPEALDIGMSPHQDFTGYVFSHRARHPYSMALRLRWSGSAPTSASPSRGHCSSPDLGQLSHPHETWSGPEPAPRRSDFGRPKALQQRRIQVITTDTTVTGPPPPPRDPGDCNPCSPNCSHIPFPSRGRVLRPRFCIPSPSLKSFLNPLPIIPPK